MSWGLWLVVGLGKLLRGTLSLIRDYPWQAAVLGLALALLLVFRQWGVDHRNLTDELGKERALVASERAAHLATVDNVRKGREAARELDRQNAQRVKSQAAAINERTIDALEARTRTYADRAERLRARLAALEAPAGGGGVAAVPGDPGATCRTFGATDCEDLAARMIDAQASIDRLIALQAWASEIVAIDVDQ